ncbi:hypothetical protein [Neolewinella antarctica]|uniref:Uncharacterized protein n=1 Tax=Neolewinella antarctica TaxID=442734 RepID=A0ABX0XEL5_9BACT|nr:hypothetical protein [Neolewinella antarctica]NJC27758.1 hypothetical protein [Neolewinella antarctica]
MLKFLPLLFLLSILSCDGNTKARKAARGENFVPDPNYLFFTNTRQQQYRLVSAGEAGNYFTHDDLLNSDAALVPVIHDDWLDDRAYLQLHTRKTGASPTPSGPIELLITSPTGDNQVTLPAKPDAAALGQLDNHLSTNRPVRIILGQDTLDAFPGLAREQAREAIFDYLRLIDQK